MKTCFQKVWKWISNILVCIMLLLAVLLVGVRLLGFQVYTVLSSSMEPTYKTGSLIYVKKVNPEEIEVGTPITFMLNSDIIATHRVVEILHDENNPKVLLFRTKGDANELIDGAPVHQNNILGEPKFSIPYLGYLAEGIQNPPGKYIAFTVCALIILLTFIPDLFHDKDENQLKKDSEEEDDTIK